MIGGRSGVIFANSYQVDIEAGVIRYGESCSLVYGEYENVGEVGFG